MKQLVSGYFLFVLLAVSAFALSAQPAARAELPVATGIPDGLKVQRYWIFLSDKGPTTSETYRSKTFLQDQGWTARAQTRRHRLGIATDFSDLPVYGPYVAALSQVEGLTVRCTSRWLNAISVEAEQTAVLAELAALPFVRSVDPVRRYRMDREEVASPQHTPAPFDQAKKAEDVDPILDYGEAAFQINMLGLPYLHERGFRGEGMLIAVLDAGWRDADVLPQFARLRQNDGIADIWNFYRNNDSVYNYSNHGTAVLSTMAGYLPGTYSGTAPNARYALYLTEVEEFERIIEEDFWVAAAERADMMGVDIINTSLGYTTFDDTDTAFNHTYADMDGRTTIISRAANRAASKGILVVVSAGNQGSSPWRYISAPADADSALAIAAVDAAGQYAAFSGKGPASDGDQKPNVAAVGSGTAVVSLSGTVAFGSGTSFAAPLIAGSAACLWQAAPDAQNMEVFQAIQESAHQFLYPDTLLGYGVPDFGLAWQLLTGVLPAAADNFSVQIQPNPVQQNADVLLGSGWSDGEVSFRIFRSDGALLLSGQLQPAASRLIHLPLERFSGWSPGTYTLQILQGSRKASVKFQKAGV